MPGQAGKTQQKMCTWDSPLPNCSCLFPSSPLLYIHRDASDQKFKRKDGNEVNHVIKAMAVAVSNCAQWLRAQLRRSLSIRTVMPAEAHAAANVRVDVICNATKGY